MTSETPLSFVFIYIQAQVFIKCIKPPGVTSRNHAQVKGQNNLRAAYVYSRKLSNPIKLVRYCPTLYLNNRIYYNIYYFAYIGKDKLYARFCLIDK